MPSSSVYLAEQLPTLLPSCLTLIPFPHQIHPNIASTLLRTPNLSLAKCFQPLFKGNCRCGRWLHYLTPGSALKSNWACRLSLTLSLPESVIRFLSFEVGFWKYIVSQTGHPKTWRQLATLTNHPLMQTWEESQWFTNHIQRFISSSTKLQPLPGYNATAVQQCTAALSSN